MKAAVIVFPGSNCDHDALYVCGKVMGWDSVPIWHESTNLGGADLVILPGGFSYGDYLRCGAIARFSPVVNAVVKHAKAGALVLGICNGFQVLLEAGMLPGALLGNNVMEFRCVWTHLQVGTSDSRFTQVMAKGDVLKVPVAHGEGNYFARPDVLKQLQDEDRIAFRYCTTGGELTSGCNPNGSIDNIAGILSEGRNVLGMMPHPERASEKELGGSDGKRLFESLATVAVDDEW